MPFSVSEISFGSGALVALITSVLLLTSWRGRALGGLLVCAMIATIAHLICGLLIANGWLDNHAYSLSFKLLRSGFWYWFLIKLLQTSNPSEESVYSFFRKNRWSLWIGFLVLCFVTPILLPKVEINTDLFVYGKLALCVMLGFSIAGLVLVEQVIRNAPREQRWAIKFLCLSLGGVFAYDFYMYAEALLIASVDRQIWAAQGFVWVLAAPLIAVSAARCPDWSLALSLSRRFVFHSAGLVGAGSYLILMAIGGLYIQSYGGTWSEVFQAVFLFASVIGLLILIFSGQVRAYVKVIVSKNLFAYRYDYREQWLRFTDTLAGRGDSNVSERVIYAMAQLVDSPGGVYWPLRETGAVADSWGGSLGLSRVQLDIDNVGGYFESANWIVEMDEFRFYPERYPDLKLPAAVTEKEEAWLLIPLYYQDELLGVVLLMRPLAGSDFNWEMIDLLKVATHQAAAVLAQHHATLELTSAKQFEAYNKLSAFVIHDLKNLASQLDMVEKNYERHKDNPEFIEDAFETVSLAVKKIQKLLHQLRSGARGEAISSVDLESLLSKLVANRSINWPQPVFKSIAEKKVIVNADGDALSNVFGHLVQNAQDATPRDGEVTVILGEVGSHAVVEIIDNGAGMTEEFIQQRLFTPFDTTKGDSGMGIGVFEARELIKKLHGSISVSSKPDQGTTFTIRLPMNDTKDD